MKNLKTNTSLVILTIIASSFSAIVEKQIDVKSSTITWNGYKVTGEHEGTIALKEGTLKFDGETLVGGNFVVDMTTIDVTDLKGEWKDKLDGHLRSDDFFSVDKHPTSTLSITNAVKKDNKYEVTADLTIKDITKPVTFDLEVNDNTATAKVKIDRTKYDIKYGSSSFFDNLKDKAISNNFDLTVKLVY